MRLIPVLALGLAVVAAGCFGGDDDTETPPTTTTPPTTSTPASTTPPTGGAGGNGTGDGGSDGSGGATPKPPMQVHSDTADFTKAPTPPATENVQTKTFTVPAGYTKLTLNVTWTATGPAVVQNGVAINILDATGTVVATCAGPAAGPTAPAPCTNEGTALAAGGEYTAEYKGSGNLQAAVTVTAS